MAPERQGWQCANSVVLLRQRRMYAGYCIARLTRQAGVPVTLNGQGGDEILSGYWQSYFLYLRELGMRGNIGSLIDHFAGALMKDGNPDLLTQAPLMLRRYRSRSNPTALVRLRKTYDAYDGHNTVLQKILALAVCRREAVPPSEMVYC